MATIEDYNRNAKELNTIVETIRTSLYGLNASIIGIEENEEGEKVNDISSYSAEKMYKNNMILHGLTIELKSMAEKYSKLNAQYFSLYLDKK